MPLPSIRTLIADDHEVFRMGVTAMLNARSHLHDISEAATFVDVQRLLSQWQFHLLLLDMDMPGMRGLISVRELRKEYPKVILIVLSGLSNRSTVAKLLASGIHGFIPKAWPLPRILDAIDRILATSQPISESTRSIFGEVQRADASITARQRDVLVCVGRGMTNKEIGLSLGIAPGTVKIHIASLLRHLNVRNRMELVTVSQSL